MTTWMPSDHDPVCAALAHDDEDSCSCGLFDESAEPRDSCARCRRLSFSIRALGWCPWCDKGAPSPTDRPGPRHRALVRLGDVQ